MGRALRLRYRHISDNCMLPSLNLDKPAGCVEIWAARASDYPAGSTGLIDCLNADERLRYAKFSNHAARNAFLVARAVLRHLLGSYLKLPPCQIPINTSENGKPFLGESLNLFFNISHSQDMVLLAFSDCQVGVDVEFCNRKVDFDAVMRRFFSQRERQDWQKNSLPTPEIAFFRGWTRKEAILKATGEGIAGLGHTEVGFAPDNNHVLLSRHGQEDASSSWFFHDFSPAEGYQAAVAVNAPEKRIIFKNLLPAD